MNELIISLILAVIQGITEFIPVSSSAHLIIASHLLNYNASLEFVVALHFGTLMAVFVYFGQDIVAIIRDLLSLKFKTEHGKIGTVLLIATIPVAIMGYLLKDILDVSSGNLIFVSLGLGITSLILCIGSLDLWRKRELDGRGAFFVGLAQTLALFRGVSRSGSTITTGLIMGMKEKEAVKFSFLLSIPVVIGANVLEIGNRTLPGNYLWASLLSFAVGLCMIHFSFTYILSDRKNFRYIAGYVFVLALGVLTFEMI